MYRIVYYLVAGNQAKCAFYFAQTLEIAGMIALAIFLVGTIVNVIRKSKKIQEKSHRKRMLTGLFVMFSQILYIHLQA